MNCIFYLFVSIVVIEANSQSIEKIILDYFKSESVGKFRKEWDKHRRPLQNALVIALQENIGTAGMNVYIRKVKEPLASGYYHNDNQVRLILKDLALQDLPRFWMPEVQFSLASNVLKIQTSISKLIIHAEYALVRNKSDIIYEPKEQNPEKSSPFLFEQVQDIGKVAISIDGCVMSGFILVTLNGESVNLGYSEFRLINCHYTIEIYRPGEDSPPVIAHYSPYRDESGLSITHLLMKPINEELLPKLQGAMFSLINTTALFDEKLQDFRRRQEVVFRSTAQYLTDVTRNLNKITIKKNNGAVNMDVYRIQWDDGSIKANDTHKNGEHVILMDMVLTGLDTVYSAHIGGPFKLNTILIAEEIRFSSLQVRGYIEVKSKSSDKYAFAAELRDVAVLIHLDVNLQPEGKNHGLKKIEVTNFRRMILTVPSLMYGSVDSVIGGYLLIEVPKQIKAHLKVALPEALQLSKSSPVKPANDTGTDVTADDCVPPSSLEINTVNEPPNSSDLDTDDNETSTSSEKKKSMNRPTKKNAKKRFKSANQLHHSPNLAKQKIKHINSKRAIDKEILRLRQL